MKNHAPLLSKTIIRVFMLFTIFTQFTLSSFAQGLSKYSELITDAWSLYQAKAYQKSGEKYAEAFATATITAKVSDRYNAACAWALSGQSDSAFVQLFSITKNGSYINLAHITTDTDLTSLQKDKRWQEVIGYVKQHKEKAEANLDKPLVALLEAIAQDDQKYRQQIEEIEKKYGWESKEMEAHWAIINEKDSLNLIKVRKILDERGWLGADIIGNPGNQTLFLVIQHADLATQEKYLPMMRSAVKDGKALAGSLALLEDRVSLGKGGKQIYGSQVTRDEETGKYYVMPLIDPDHVNERRASVGLGTIEEYLTNWQLKWNVEEYKKMLPQYIKMQGEFTP